MKRRRCIRVEKIAPRQGGGHLCTGPCGHPHLHRSRWYAHWLCPHCTEADQ